MMCLRKTAGRASSFKVKLDVLKGFVAGQCGIDKVKTHEHYIEQYLSMQVMSRCAFSVIPLSMMIT